MRPAEGSQDRSNSLSDEWLTDPTPDLKITLPVYIWLLCLSAPPPARPRYEPTFDSQSHPFVSR